MNVVCLHLNVRAYVRIRNINIRYDEIPLFDYYFVLKCFGTWQSFCLFRASTSTSTFMVHGFLLCFCYECVYICIYAYWVLCPQLCWAQLIYTIEILTQITIIIPWGELFQFRFWLCGGTRSFTSKWLRRGFASPADFWILAIKGRCWMVWQHCRRQPVPKSDEWTY